MPRSAESNERVRVARREQILHAALGVFSRRGLAATGVTDIAAAAGVSSGLLYHYFPSKVDVYTALVEGALRGTLQLTTAALEAPGSPADRLRALVAGLLEGARQDPDYALLVVQAQTDDTAPTEAIELVREHGQRNLDLVAALVRAGQEAGELIAGEPREIALLLLSVIQGLAATSRLRAGDEFPSVDAFLSLFLRPAFPRTEATPHADS